MISIVWCSLGGTLEPLGCAAVDAEVLTCTHLGLYSVCSCQYLFHSKLLIARRIGARGLHYGEASLLLLSDLFIWASAQIRLDKIKFAAGLFESRYANSQQKIVWETDTKLKTRLMDCIRALYHSLHFHRVNLCQHPRIKQTDILIRVCRHFAGFFKKKLDFVKKRKIFCLAFLSWIAVICISYLLLADVKELHN